MFQRDNAVSRIGQIKKDIMSDDKATVVERLEKIRTIEALSYNVVILKEALAVGNQGINSTIFKKAENTVLASCLKHCISNSTRSEKEMEEFKQLKEMSNEIDQSSSVSSKELSYYNVQMEVSVELINI